MNEQQYQRKAEAFIDRHLNSPSEHKIKLVHYMVEAIHFFQNIDDNTIKRIVLEIAKYSNQHGIDISKTDYNIELMPNKEFNGATLLAYYYVGTSISLPDLVSELRLPYKTEFEIAKKLYNETKSQESNYTLKEKSIGQPKNVQEAIDSIRKNCEELGIPFEDVTEQKEGTVSVRFIGKSGKSNPENEQDEYSKKE